MLPREGIDVKISSDFDYFRNLLSNNFKTIEITANWKFENNSYLARIAAVGHEEQVKPEI